MSLGGIKALTFDTGGTILDWHTGLRTALAAAGARHGVEKDWPALTNEFRRRSLKRMLNHGEHAPAIMNFDDVHRETLGELVAEAGLDMFTPEDRRSIWWDAIHSLKIEANRLTLEPLPRTGRVVTWCGRGEPPRTGEAKRS